MEQQVKEFLQNQRVSSLAIVLPDGSVHAGTLHYSHQDNPLQLFFSTENTSRKCQGLLEEKSAKAAVVIGFSEKVWITLQMDGDVKGVFDSEELKQIKQTHYVKHPSSQQYEHDPATIFLAFTPIWWRFTDYNTEPLTIISSE